MTQPKEPANGSKSDQNIIFLFETIVYFFVQLVLDDTVVDSVELQILNVGLRN